MAHKFDFYYDFGSNHRKAYRISIPDLICYIFEFGKQFKVRDISSRGMSFYLGEEDKTLKKQKISLSLYLNDQIVLDNLSTQVVRIKPEYYALQFIELDSYQEKILDKIILEAQKKEINKKKKTKELYCYF